MWNKIYLITLAAAIIAMGILLYLPFSWLQSITAPRDVELHYKYYANISWTFLLISTLVLLVLGNVLLWLTRRSWAMWATFLYFAVFMIAQTFWLENSFFRYKQANNLEAGLVSWSPLVGVVLIVLTAVIVFFDQYLVKRLQDKMYPSALPIESPPEEPLIEEKNI